MSDDPRFDQWVRTWFGGTNTLRGALEAAWKSARATAFYDADHLGPLPPSAKPFAEMPGNAGHVLHILRTWARQHPDAVFRVR